MTLVGSTWRTAHRSEKQMVAINNEAATYDPKESILRFANKKGSPKNPKCSLSSAFMPGWGRPGRRWSVKGSARRGFQGPGELCQIVKMVFDQVAPGRVPANHHRRISQTVNALVVHNRTESGFRWDLFSDV